MFLNKHLPQILAEPVAAGMHIEVAEVAGMAAGEVAARIVPAVEVVAAVV